MEVTFWKLTEQRVSHWEAIRPGRVRVPGSTMALGRGGMPHDLQQMVVESTLGLERGFWGSVAAGATFRSTGRRRTQPGRAVIAANSGDLDEAERLANAHAERWCTRREGPCAEALDRMADHCDRLPDGHGLVVEWPSLRIVGTTDAAPVLGRRHARRRGARSRSS